MDNMRSCVQQFFINAYKRAKKLSERPIHQREMTPEDEEFLRNNLNFSFMADASNIKMMSRFTPQSREEFARKTGSLVLYPPDEAIMIKDLEEKAALRAAPSGYELKQLNGINVGCGDRRICEYLTPVDIMRESQESSGEHHAFLKDAVLANPEDLPFKAESIDYIVALHMLEHVANPVEVLLHWETILKPGGGIGLVLPDYEYTWNATGDQSQFGHKWNASAEIFRKLFEMHLHKKFELEVIDTLKSKISFDVVLRKRGVFRPFTISNATSTHSGAELARMGLMVSQMNDFD
ncbi:methyltransferase domain-containing protein [Agrobacterium rubi]|uniref:methyltransferase domain-containing protein n=1 Tax=Agrobacterium rubi TaxID=28099 RepID=UPI00201B602C|nr:class I SAM-dependent methyltransferase [Agrobacterium rubi]